MTPHKFELPTFEQCEQAVRLDVAGPLEAFVYDNEPLTKRDSAEWRGQLTEIISTAIRGDLGTV